MRGAAARMHDAFRNGLMVEMRDLLAELEVLQQARSAQAGAQRVLVVGNRYALCCGQQAVLASGLVLALTASASAGKRRLQSAPGHESVSPGGWLMRACG